MSTVPPGPARARVDGSMSLLVDMMTNSLDEAYSVAALRRAGQAGPGASGPGAARPGGAARRAVAAVLLVTLGLVTGTAAAQVRKRQGAGSGIRTQLLSDVHRRTAETDAQAAQASRLRGEVAADQTAALRSNAAGQVLSHQLAALELAVGLDPVRGPGLVVRLDDAPASRAPGTDNSSQPPVGRVQDLDLQDAVNGLWSAGAEAVAINGLRLSVLTAIRSAGEAILVDYRPLSPPYTLRAIGDPHTLQARFADSAAGRRLASYPSLYGISVDVRPSSSQSLPGGPAPALRLASPVAAAS